MEELAVVYLSEAETKELNDTSESSKCGEVFRSTSGKYSLSCSHCNHCFTCLTEFSQHIEQHFQLISIATISDADVALDAKDGILTTIDIKEEPEFHVHEIKVEINDSHLMKKRARKKIKQPEDEHASRLPPKTAKLKISKSSLKEPANNMWICDICGKIFSTKNHICQHMKLHRNAPKEHRCHLCGFEFYEKGNLTRHLRTHNNDPKAFKCDICNKGTSHRPTV